MLLEVCAESQRGMCLRANDHVGAANSMEIINKVRDVRAAARPRSHEEIDRAAGSSASGKISTTHRRVVPYGRTTPPLYPLPVSM